MDARTLEQELLTHAAATRALAASLVGAQQADDVVQETSLQALAQRPPIHGGLRPWLFSATIGNARKLLRSNVRRTARERAAAKPDLSEPPDLNAQRKEAILRLNSALASLREPYLTTLLLRYFQDFSPTQIAAQLALPLATVKSQLQRALSLLRRRLDTSDSKNWRGQFCLAFAIPPVSSPPPFRLLAISAVLMLAAPPAAWLLISHRSTDAACPSLETATQAMVAPTTTEEGAPNESAHERSDIAANTPTQAQIIGQVLLPDGHPCCEADVVLTHPKPRIAFQRDSWYGQQTAKVAPDGRFLLDVAPPKAGTVYVAIHSPQYPVISGYVHGVHQGSLTDMGALQLVSGRTVKLRFMDESDVPVSGVHGGIDIEKVSFPQSIRPYLGLSLQADTSGMWESYTPLCDSSYRLRLAHYAILGSPHITVGSGHDSHAVRLRARPQEVVLSGSVTDSNGRPIRGALIEGCCLFDKDRPLQAVADQYGTFTLSREPGLPPGPIQVMATQSDSGEVSQTTQFNCGATDAQLVLGRTAALRVEPTFPTVRPSPLDLEWVVLPASKSANDDYDINQARKFTTHETQAPLIAGLRPGRALICLLPKDDLNLIAAPTVVDIPEDGQVVASTTVWKRTTQRFRVTTTAEVPLVGATLVVAHSPHPFMYLSAAQVGKLITDPYVIDVASTDARGECVAEGPGEHAAFVFVVLDQHVLSCTRHVMGLQDTIDISADAGQKARLLVTPVSAVQAFRLMAGLPSTGPAFDTGLQRAPSIQLRSKDRGGVFPSHDTGFPIGEDGAVDAIHVKPGSYKAMLRFLVDDGPSIWWCELADVTLTSRSDERTPIDLSAVIPGRLSGRVTTIDTDLPRTARISVETSHAAKCQTRFFRVDVAIDEQGFFNYIGLPGKVKIMLGSAGSEEVDLAPAQVLERNLVIRAYPITFRLVMDGAPVAANQVAEIRDDTGRNRSSAKTTELGEVSTQLEAGQYWIDLDVSPSGSTTERWLGSALVVTGGTQVVTLLRQ